MKTKHLSNILLASLLVALGQAGISQTKLLDVLQDENAQSAVFLIYNNIDAARAEAKLIDGKAIAADVREEVRVGVAQMKEKIGKVPGA